MQVNKRFVISLLGGSQGQMDPDGPRPSASETCRIVLHLVVVVVTVAVANFIADIVAASIIIIVSLYYRDIVGDARIRSSLGVHFFSCVAATINKAIAEHIIVMIAPEGLEKITAMSVIAMPIGMAAMLLPKTIVF